MKHLLNSLSVFLLLCVVGVALSIDYYPPAPKPDCRRVRCATPLCANPVTPPGQCCPSCDDSNCKFTGCVNDVRQDGDAVVWRLGGCGNCRCQDNQVQCGFVGCPVSVGPDGKDFDPCPGVPKVNLPWDCCPVCDYGFPPNRCGVVATPFPRKFTISSGRQCSGEAPTHQCDKRGFRLGNGKKFRCQEVYGNRRLDLDGCDPFKKLHYQDVVRCKPVQDDDIIVGCDILVD